MPSAKENRAAAKRQGRWRPSSNIAASSRDVLEIAARQCGQVLMTVPETDGRAMPEEIEMRYLDRFSYWADPSDVRDDPPHDACDCDVCRRRPQAMRRRVDQAVMAEMQDPSCAAIFGS